MAQLLRELRDEDLPPQLPAPQRLAPTIADAIETLRLDGVAPEAVRERAARPEAPATFRAVSVCYDAYHKRLDAQALHDAHPFRRAAEQVRDGEVPVVADTVVAIYDAVDLPAPAHNLMAAVRDDMRRSIAWAPTRRPAPRRRRQRAGSRTPPRP